MDVTQPVCVVERRGNGLDDLGSSCGCDPVSGFEDLLLKGASTLDVFHRHEEVPLVHADVVDTHDVRMIDLRNDLAFGMDPLAILVIVGKAGLHDLQRNLALQRDMGGEIHSRHRTLAELALDAVTRDLRKGGSDHQLQAKITSEGTCGASCRRRCHRFRHARRPR